MQLPIDDIDEKPPEKARITKDPAIANEHPPAAVAERNLPATIPFAAAPVRRRLRFSVGLIAVLLVAGAGGVYWWKHSQAQLPAGHQLG